MDPITAAIAGGAAAGLTDTAAQAVRDAYRVVKAFLHARYPSVDIGPLEARPDSQPKQASLSEDLAAAGADRDPELVALAKYLVETLQREAPHAANSIGVDLERVRADFLTVDQVTGESTGVRARDVETRGGISIRDVHSGGGRDPNV